MWSSARRDYATGQIRATLGATPHRLTVLAPKAVTFVGVVLAAGLVTSFASFVVMHLALTGKGLGVSLGDPGVLRAVRGGALYLAGVGLVGLGFGAVIRRTAGAIAALVGLLFVIPLMTSFFQASWVGDVARYLPAQAGTAVFSVVPDPRMLGPWPGFSVLVAYAALALVVGGTFLVRRDA